jgi:hypothetical protein
MLKRGFIATLFFIFFAPVALGGSSTREGAGIGVL